MFKDNGVKKKRGQGIVKVSNLFDKYKKTLRAPQRTVIETAREMLRGVFHIEVASEACTYSPHSRILSLNISGLKKTEILKRKNEILTTLRELLGEKSAPKDIL